MRASFSNYVLLVSYLLPVRPFLSSPSALIKPLARQTWAALALGIVFLNGCVPYPHSEDPLYVYGEVIDNQNLRPLKGVMVSVKFPKNFGYREDESDGRGRFNVPSHNGWLYSVSMFPEEDFTEVRIRATIEHPDYQTEEIDEVFPVEGQSPPKINLGTVYLDRK